MKPLGIEHFDDYFNALHGHDPYPWQRRLAEAALAGNWPPAIDLPTSSGKTACLDIAVFALACQASRGPADRTAPVRIFFCVNRRVIVDEAYQRAERIAKRIWQAEQGATGESPVLGNVAQAMRRLTGALPRAEFPPLDVLQLRGGIYRDNRWARSATQPTIICTTVDQLGSRLLFRGYGVSDNAAPIQAALIAYDSLILLDEAHISRPFMQTLTNIRRYLDPERWAERPLGINPVVIVPMTATPPEGVISGELLTLDPQTDRKNPGLNNRLAASKPAVLRLEKDVVSGGVLAAEKLAETKPTAVGIIVDRVATARAVFEQLCKRHPDVIVELVIGSMRPIDRDKQMERLRDLIGPKRPTPSVRTSFIVATQCLEVGADYDFDALVTECASLDALRQRFGRLNRSGRDIEARAVIIADKRSIKPDETLKSDKPEDPVYGNALARTWNWLSRIAEKDTVDFGVGAFDDLLAKYGEEGRIPLELQAPSARLDAPVMLPAYVDCWCQTSPRPVPDPDVALFLHGRQHADTDVQVCWRADLKEDESLNRDKWCDVVALLPPTSAECMTVPLSRARRWLAHREVVDETSDLLEVASGETEDVDNNNRNHQTRSKPTQPCVLWRGPKESKLIDSLRDLRPGDTMVMPVSAGGWDELGHLPAKTGWASDDTTPNPSGNDSEEPRSPDIDVAEIAYQNARDRVVLRLHPFLLGESKDRDELIDYMAQREDFPTVTQWREVLAETRNRLPPQDPLRLTLEHLLEGFTWESYPDNRGIVLTSRRCIGTSTNWFLPPLDDGDDVPSRVGRTDPIPLGDHTQHGINALCQSLAPLSLNGLDENLAQALSLHDLGKADERFQAMLRRTDRTDAWLLTGRSSTLIAKSDGLALTPSGSREARQRAGLPDGFRHEMLSVRLAEQADLPEDPVLRNLVLHLIAAHHGYARPFAPVVVDDDPPDVEVQGLSIATTDRLSHPAHRLDSGIPERFWNLTRHFGWWGLAYLESLVRLADQQASAAEDAGTVVDTSDSRSTEPPA